MTLVDQANIGSLDESDFDAFLEDCFSDLRASMLKLSDVMVAQQPMEDLPMAA